MQDFTTPMMKQYQQMKKEHADCLLLFRLGDFYELFLEDAYIGAKVLDITLTGRPKGKDGRIPMAGVPYHAIDSYLAKLVRAGYKVAICEQLSPPNTKGLIERKIVRIVTPGTITDEKALEKKENNFLVTVAFHKNWVGIAAVDLGTGEFLVNQFPKNGWEKKIGDELTKLHPSECILSDSAYNQPDILKTLSLQKGMNIFRFPLWERLAYRASSILKKQFGIQSLSSFHLEDKSAALQAAAAILGYLSETQKDSLVHLSRITLLEEHDYLQLDKSTITNLELFSTLRDRDRQGSLIETLDKTCTGMGGRLLRQWFLKPLNNRQRIVERQEAVGYFLNHHQQATMIREVLKSLIDSERLTSRLSLHLGGARELVALKMTLQELQTLSFSPSNELISQFLSLCQSKELATIVHMIEKSILDRPAIDLKSGGIIKNGIDADLDLLREVVAKNQGWLGEFEKQERTRTGIHSLKVRFNSVFGFYIEITKPNLALAPKDYIRKQTMVNGERFITEELKRHEEQILTASEKINRLEYEIWQKTVGDVLEYIPFLQELSAAIAVSDCLLNFAALAADGSYCCPVITEGEEMNIVGGRHPVVEKLLPSGEFTPNDCYVNTSSNQLLLVTGPNMAGKSVFLRQTAVIVLLAQVGSYVPATQAQIGLIDHIFVRSGATDAITAGLSTFMVEMVETAHILMQATNKSLIIMDEIGRGTSTYDGISIAWAVAEFLVTKGDHGPKTLFATHYHELQELENRHPKRIVNMQMAISHGANGPVFLHTLIPGGASHSYGVAVAKLAGIPERVIERANEILMELEKNHTQGIRKKSQQEKKVLPPNQKADRLLSQIRDLDVNTITPLEALTILNRLKTTIDE